jgi:hypothetical protein
MTVDDDRKLNWLNEPAGSPTREIRYQKQLRSMTRKVDHTSIINRLYAYGYGEGDAQLKLTDAGEAHEYIETSPAPSPDELQIDRITDLRITHPSTLLLWAQKVLAEYSVPVYSYTVDIVNLAEHANYNFDLEDMTVGAIVRVVNPDLIDSLTGTAINVNVKVVSVETDLSNPENITLELANATKSLADLMGNTNTFKNIAENVACRISAGNVVVLGTFTVQGWASAGTTTIDGGNITAGTITAAKLTITPLVAGGAAADVNANTTTISGGKITTNTIDADAIKTSTLNAKTITLGTTGGDAIIKSGNYVADTSGWQIKANGDAEFNNCKIRGTLYTTTVDSGSTLKISGNMTSNVFTLGTEGWKLDGNGNAYFRFVDITGDLDCVNIGAAGAVSVDGNLTGNLVRTITAFRLAGDVTAGDAPLRSIYTTNGVTLYWKDAGGTSHALY